MFSLDQKVVYPGHGVAQVTKIFEKQFGTQKLQFFELCLVSTDMTVMVPMAKAVDVGIRSLSSKKSISAMLETLSTPDRKLESLELTASNWNRRNKEYQNKLRIGSLKDISEIYRDLKYIACYKELSFGEKNLLNKTESLLVEEMSTSEEVDENKAIERLRSFFVPISVSPKVQHA
jgi:CarD family transcriptional regulator